jgi:flagellar biosynthesis/type III secretory pathway chaperone
MKVHPSVDIQPLIRSLIQTLDIDIVQIRHSLTLLESLRVLVIKRDESGLSALLSEVRQQNRSNGRCENQRQVLRERLGAMLGYERGSMTLSHLLGHVSGPLHDEVSQKRAQLQHLLEQLQEQWELTHVLLRDCARLNRRLLNAIFSQTGSSTYGPGGLRQTLAQTHVVNMNI